ncbi:MAG TPA: hypothetical protein VEZ71_30470, partial [Archangium sp.]|nr:hypothetical protein [Archangium sp.]
MRGLDPRFILDLQGGRLAPLLRRVKSDETLDLQLRRNSLTVYYRGTSLLTVTEQSSGSYHFNFDVSYFQFEEPSRPCVERVMTVTSEQDCMEWLAHVPQLKDAMDRWRTLKKSAWEREAQQFLVRDNNRGEVGRSTDYFICDVEY